MSHTYAEVSPVLSNLSYNRAFVNDVYSKEKSRYSDDLDRIRHLAWRYKLSSDQEKNTEFLSEMLETAATL